MFRTMPPVEGVAEALWRLSDAGVWIRLITHRLYANWGHAVAVGDTVAWLDEVGIPYRDLCFLGRKPEVEADAYVDDAPHNIEELRRAGNTVVVFDQPYNRHLDGPRAAHLAGGGAPRHRRAPGPGSGGAGPARASTTTGPGACGPAWLPRAARGGRLPLAEARIRAKGRSLGLPGSEPHTPAVVTDGKGPPPARRGCRGDVAPRPATPRR